MRAKNEEKKIEVYEFINRYISINGTSPTTAEICAAVGLAKATVSKYVNRLAEEGLLDRVGRYGLISSSVMRPKARMPIIGTVACGKPKLADEDVEGYITVDEDIMGGYGEYFALVADGDSMINVGIDSGDIVYIEKTDYAENGSIVVALIEDNETSETRATLKRFFRDEENKCYILRPENDALSDIIVSEVKILGVAKRVLKRL